MPISDLLILIMVGALALAVLAALTLLVLAQLHQLTQPVGKPRRSGPKSFHVDSQPLAFEIEHLRERHRRWNSLTLRQREIARLAAEGKQNGEIAQALHLRSSTVATHLKNTYKTLGVHSRRELANFVQDIET